MLNIAITRPSHLLWESTQTSFPSAPGQCIKIPQIQKMLITNHLWPIFLLLCVLKPTKYNTSLVRAPSGNNRVGCSWLFLLIFWDHPSPAVLEDGSASQGLQQSQPEALLYQKTKTPSAFQHVPQSLLQCFRSQPSPSAVWQQEDTLPAPGLAEKGFLVPSDPCQGGKHNHLLLKLFFNILLLS